MKKATAHLGTTVITAWLVLVGVVAFNICFLQVMPADWWLAWSSVTVNEKDNVPIVIFERKVRRDLEVNMLVEIHAADNPAEQPCASDYHTVEEANTERVIQPLQKVLPNCNFNALRDRPLVVEISYTFDLDYGIHKFTKSVSAPFILKAHGAAR